MVEAETLGDLLDVDRHGAHRSELLGEVALEPAEDDQRHDEEDEAERQHAGVEAGVGHPKPWEGSTATGDYGWAVFSDHDRGRRGHAGSVMTSGVRGLKK